MGIANDGQLSTATLISLQYENNKKTRKNYIERKNVFTVNK